MEHAPLDGIWPISPNFGIMEQQAGPGGSSSSILQPSPKPGQMRLWTFQSIAHGADYIGYFRWRTSVVGTEIYWHGLLNYDGLPNRRIDELKRIFSDVSKISALAGSKYAAEVAVLQDYDNIWDSELDRWHGALSRPSEKNLFCAMQHAHTPCDYVYLDETTSPEQLSRYRLLIDPHPAILTKRTAELLEKYVRGGGMLLFGARTGYKDEHGRCRRMPAPGFAADLCGIRVKDFTFVRPEEPVSAMKNEQRIDMPLFNEILAESSPDVKVLARYRDSYCGGEAAVTKRTVGKGAAFYFAAGFNEQNVQVILDAFGVSEPCRDRFLLPECCELAIREKAGCRYYFVLNYSSEDQTVRIKQPMMEMLSGTKREGRTVLPKYGVFVLKQL